jgi:hypothetical protein
MSNYRRIIHINEQLGVATRQDTDVRLSAVFLLHSEISTQYSKFPIFDKIVVNNNISAFFFRRILFNETSQNKTQQQSYITIESASYQS